MANTFFGFNNTVNNDSGDEVGECTEGLEDEYDALNDETFGELENTTDLDDWEHQHEQFAEFAESSRQSEQLENSLRDLVLDDSEETVRSAKDTTWSFANGGICDSKMLDHLQKTVNNHMGDLYKQFNNKISLPPPLTHHAHQGVKTICTVEELERNIRQQKIVQPPPPHIHQNFQNLPPPQIHHPLFHQQGGLPPPLRLPPGLTRPMGVPPPMGMRLPPGIPPSNIPPGFPPGIVHPGHPGFNPMFPNNMHQFPVNHPFNFPPPPLNQPHPMSRIPQQNNRSNNNNSRNDSRYNQEEYYNRDDYAGLMSNQEKQWLLNIQQLQLNTGTPYFDDYYYTIFKERKSRNNKENQLNTDRRYQKHNRNQDRQENTLTPRVYTPLQFENSLGRLQCGSVTAPRKIIDMDVVTLEKDSEGTPVRDTRKTKQLLLELEGLYSLLLKAEDLRNPVAISNMEKLVEIKQKQRLKELEAAQTSEQKQDILRLLQQESMPLIDNQIELLQKVITTFLQEDKFVSFMNIRKGKMLLLRILPHLSSDNFTSIYSELWIKFLLSLPAIGRRDTAGDNILPKFHAYFKRYIHSVRIPEILEIVSNLVEVIKPENSRSTPLSHLGRAPLQFVISNKFGVSAMATMFVRTEYLMTSDNITDEQRTEWTNFMLQLADLCSGKCSVSRPLELIPKQIFIKHAARLEKLTEDKKLSIEKHFVDVI